MSSHRNPFKSLMVLLGALTVLAVAGITSRPAEAQQATVSSSLCSGCVDDCPLSFGITCGFTKGIGGNQCTEGTMPPPLPGGEAGCACFIGGGLCGLRSAMGIDERSRHERHALEMVSNGATLPSDGLFYYGRAKGDLVLKWKCDNSVAGRVATRNVGVERATKLGG